MWGKILKDKERLFEKNVLDVFFGVDNDDHDDCDDESDECDAH